MLTKPVDFELTQSLLRNVDVKPDILLKKDHKKVLVLDAKYKKSFSDDDVYQALAYSLAFETSAVLVLPMEEQNILGRYDVIEVPNSRVFIITLSLGVEAKGYEDYIQTLKGESTRKNRLAPKKWNLLTRCLESEYLIAGEAKVIEAAQMATIIALF